MVRPPDADRCFCSLRSSDGRCSVDASLLADGSIRRYRRRVAWLIAVARRRGVLDQPNIVREHVPCHRSCRVLVARVLIVHSERHACSDRHVVECDLIPIRRNHLERNAGETPPAWMRVRRAHARGTSLRRWRKVRSTRRRSHEDDSNRCGCGLARGRRRLIARRQRHAGNRHDRPKRYPHNG